MIPKHAGILVVESTAIVRRQISSFLVSSGLPKVTSLSSPSEALELLETKPCHLIFSDWHFEFDGGPDFLRKIRKHTFPRVRNIGFIVLTADSRRESIEDAMLAGADDYILKPLTGNHIQARVTSLLMKFSANQ